MLDIKDIAMNRIYSWASWNFSVAEEIAIEEIILVLIT